MARRSSSTVLSLALLVTLVVTAVLTDVVQFTPCSAPAGSADSSCTVHNVDVTPCPEASENKPCKIKRGNQAAIIFDYTSHFSAETVDARAYWANRMSDLPFIGMDTNGCNYTTCPVEAETNGTYHYVLQIDRKFPVRTYDVKWKLENTNNTEQNCCFIFKIKLVNVHLLLERSALGSFRVCVGVYMSKTSARAGLCECCKVRGNLVQVLLPNMPTITSHAGKMPRLPASKMPHGRQDSLDDLVDALLKAREKVAAQRMVPRFTIFILPRDTGQGGSPEGKSRLKAGLCWGMQCIRCTGVREDF